MEYRVAGVKDMVKPMDDGQEKMEAKIDDGQKKMEENIVDGQKKIEKKIDDGQSDIKAGQQLLQVLETKIAKNQQALREVLEDEIDEVRKDAKDKVAGITKNIEDQ